MRIVFGFFLLFYSIVLTAQQDKDSLISNTDQEFVPLRVGLVLSGGGAKGLAHIGVLKVLEEEGVYIDYIGGTSMGGLIGGLYASGYSPAQLEQICKEMPWSKLLSDLPMRDDLPLDEKKPFDEYILSLPMDGIIPGLPKGLKTGQLILNYINKLTWNVAGIHDFEELPIPYFCVATKLETGDTMVIHSGDLALAMRATMSIPSVFEPVEVNGEYVIDGGLVNNFPVDIMLQRSGVDFVIGVDVGAPLYKANEITSIVDILDQTSSFHNQERFQYNKRLVDIYIQPDITGLSALSFDDIDSIIYRGEVAARAYLAEIRAISKVMYNNKVKFELQRSKKVVDTIHISEMKIKGLDNVSKGMVLGRMGLNIPGANSIENINNAIDRLYSSQFFRKINYELIKDNESYILNLDITEKEENIFLLGANYNTETGANVKLGLSFNNVLFKGSKMHASIEMGSNPAGEIRYLLDRGKRLGYGTSAKYHTRAIYTYNDTYTSTTGRYFSSFSEMALFGYFNYSNNAALIMGGSVDFFGIKSEVSAIPLDKMTKTYYRGFTKFVLDNYDDKFFPTKGRFLEIDADYVQPDIGTGFAFFKLDLRWVTPLSKRIMFVPSVFIGGSLTNYASSGYSYVIGGSNQSRYQNFITMPGLPYTAEIDNNFASPI
mgnify:FL=1